MEYVLELTAVHRATDRELSLGSTVRAVAAGDRDAFARLYADYSRMVHAVLLGRIPRRDVDDLVQDVFLTAYTRIRTDYLRQSREQVELPAELPGGDPIDAEAFAVLDVIRSLPDAYRDTLLMRLVEGMSGQEIADRTGLAPGSVRVNLHRGMKLLREKLG
jgi:RNA polymerase sigma-70 factor (ECF subfamily)